MPDFGRFLENRAFKIILCICLAMYFFAQFNVPYRDHDPFSYVLIGKGIYQYGVWPYGFVFDHKPILLYLIYGLLSFIDPHFYELKLLSAACILGVSLIVHGLLLDRPQSFIVVLAVVAACVVGTVGYSGNSELIYVPLELLSVGLLVGSRNRFSYFAGSAIVAIAAFNTNYACGFALFPALLYGLFATSQDWRRFCWRLALYGVVCIVAMGAIVAIMFAGHADVFDYFGMQYRFLTQYAEGEGRPDLLFMAKLVGVSSATVLPFLPPLRAAERDQRQVDHMLVILLLSSILSLVLSGKYYSHYLYMGAGPATVLFLRAASRVAIGRMALLFFLVAVCGVYLYGFARFAIDKRYAVDDLIKPYSRIAAIAGDAPVMSMRSNIVPLYYSGVYPFQRFVWFDQAGIIFGPREDAYFLQELGRQPRFVMTEHGWCAGKGAGWKSCRHVVRNYSQVISFAGEGNVPSKRIVIIGYDLYQAHPARSVSRSR